MRTFERFQVSLAYWLPAPTLEALFVVSVNFVLVDPSSLFIAFSVRWYRCFFVLRIDTFTYSIPRPVLLIDRTTPTSY